MYFTRSLLCIAILGCFSTATALVHQHHKFHHNSSLQVNSPRMATAGTYNLRDSYTAANFFSQFSFFTGPDPTHGFVQYLSHASAYARGLVTSKNSKIYMGVDWTTKNPTAGRASVRLTSKKSYNHGLFIADIQHMPQNACGVWPAFWMFGPNWPGSGEIDIIEGVNQMSSNAITLHTASGCNINTGGSRSGTYLKDSNCNAGNGNTGCSAQTSAPYGDKFNAGRGGVYAMQWESSGIYVWFWPRNSIPADITSGRPVTGNWGTPLVSFNGGSGCNIDSYFKNQNIVFDTTFCGDWAGSVWGSGSCASKAPTCQSYVANNPAAFQRAYWSVNYVKVYQL